MRKDITQRQATHLTCRCCGRTLSVSEFERYRTGTYRPLCRQCKYDLYDRRYYLQRKLCLTERLT